MPRPWPLGALALLALALVLSGCAAPPPEWTPIDMGPGEDHGWDEDPATGEEDAGPGTQSVPLFPDLVERKDDTQTTPSKDSPRAPGDGGGGATGGGGGTGGGRGGDPVPAADDDGADDPLPEEPLDEVVEEGEGLLGPLLGKKGGLLGL